jgi:hypothetical protein
MSVIMVFFGLSLMIIGRGPDHDLISSIFMVVLGIVAALGAFSPGTRVRGAFSRGKGPSVPINRAGRVILFAVAIVLVVVGLRGLFR